MVKKIDCFIPCRKNGDFLKNLNFLEIDNIKLVEHTIKVSINSKLFRNIYLLTNDKTSFERLKKKYNTLKIVYTKITREPFYKIIEKLDSNTYFNEDIDICVLLPNYPFKTYQTIKKIYKTYKKNKVKFIATAKKEFFFYYSKKKNNYMSINFSSKIRSRKKIAPLYKLSGGIFFYNSNKKNLDLNKVNLKNLYFINDHEAFGIYSLYDFITANSLFDIDPSILIKMSN